MENSQAPALLLLPGFGVGSFHYDEQLRDLGKDYRVWAIDFLGQGGSWPSHDPAPSKESRGGAVEAQIKESDWGFGPIAEPWAEELVYSVDLWRDQVHVFVQKVSVFLIFTKCGYKNIFEGILQEHVLRFQIHLHLQY